MLVKTKKWMAFLLILAMVVVAWGVVPAAAQEGEEFDITKLKIGYIYLILEHPYYQAHSRHVQEYAEELGFELIARDGQFDAAVQASAMEDLIALGVDGIVFCLADSAASVPSIQEAQEAGIPVVTFAIPHGEEADCPFVGIPESVLTSEAGQVAARRFHDRFGEDAQAKVVTVECPAVSQVVERADGFIAGFMEVDPNAEVLERADGQCVRDAALAATEDLIQAHPDLNVLYGGNGDSALGALAALEGAGMGTPDKVFLVSHDGSEPELVKLVDPDSALKLAAANRPRELARGTIDTLIEVIKGERPMVEDTKVMITGEVLTPDDIWALEGFVTEQYFGEIDLEQYAELEKVPEHVGLTVMTMEHPYFQSIVAEWEKIAETYGFELTVMDPGFDNAKLAGQVEDLTALGVDAIAFAPLEKEVAVNHLEVINEAGIPVVAYNVKPAKDVAPVVVGSNYVGGLDMGRYAASYWQKHFANVEPKAIILDQPEIVECIDRADGFTAGFRELYPDFEPLERLNGGGVRDVAVSVMEDALQAHPDVNLVFGINDDSALGAVAALQGAGKDTPDQVVVFGFDASRPAVVEMLKENSIFIADMGNPPKTMSDQTWFTLWRVYNEQYVPSFQEVPFPVIDASNAANWVDVQYPE